MANDWTKLILGEEDSQTAPICNGQVRELIADLARLTREVAALREGAEKREAQLAEAKALVQEARQLVAYCGLNFKLPSNETTTWLQRSRALLGGGEG